MNFDSYSACSLCPRDCRVDRRNGRLGFCREASLVRAAHACLHFGEEPPITGRGGSGTVFFSGCTLRCRFCQNRAISHDGLGSALEVEELVAIFLMLEKAGAENLNAVTGSHFAPSILAAYAAARAEGLAIPLVWNSSGYETLDAVRALAPHVGFFLPDLKTLDPELAASCFRARDYPERAAEAVLAMVDDRPLVRRPDGTPVQGVIVRHLVLPGHVKESLQVLRWFAERLAGRALLSLMSQYTPIPGASVTAPFDRPLTEAEWNTVLGSLEDLGIEDGYFQELVRDRDWLPDFNSQKPFSADLSRTVWHWAYRGCERIPVAPLASGPSTPARSSFLRTVSRQGSA